MAVDVESIVGKHNLAFSARAEVENLIRTLQVPAATKRYLFARWYKLVGKQPTVRDLDAVAVWKQ